MAYEVTLGGAVVRAELRELADGRYEVSLDGHPCVVDARFPEPGVIHMIRDGEAYELDVRATDSGQEVTLYGSRYLVEVLDERRKVLRTLAGGAGGAGGRQVLSTSMPGKVVALLVEAGEAVEEGQGIVVVEAMKMENELKAESAGVVLEIVVAAGDTVEGGATLVVLGPVEAE